ncbi:MAG: BlaI/MecI/CopY family transcriptional regulator [Phycisphaerae bacterium]|nr:BlaI/MecI/CopY family transcriptional regulator [Phycisphaerae bacterium]
MPRKNHPAGRSADVKLTLNSIPNAEMDVLSCVWREEPVTAARIREMMKNLRPMAHGSVVTLLNRLVNKGLVSKEKGAVGKAFVFKSRTSPVHLHRRLVREMLDRVFQGRVVDMVSTILQVAKSIDSELVELKKLIGSMRPSRKSRR